MYCKHCGKEISDEAIACPGCGHPTKCNHARKERPSMQDPRLSNPAAIAGLVLSAIAFVAGIVLLSISLAKSYGSILYYNILVVLPAVLGLALDIFGFSRARIFGTFLQKALAIVGMVLAGIALLYFFICCAVII